jgi:hypothetical protein
MSARDIAGDDEAAASAAAGDGAAVVFVGSSRRRYVISAKHLSHPLITTGIDKVADGLHLRRRPKVGAVGVGVLQDNLRRRPSAYKNPRRRH